LTDGLSYANFRNSKLTYYLRESLGGNSKTTLVCTASKRMCHLEESVQTMKFASRARNLKNLAVTNVQKSHRELEMMIDKLRNEIA
jgi:ubiquitin C-terminal hydrolase